MLRQEELCGSSWIFWTMISTALRFCSGSPLMVTTRSWRLIPSGFWESCTHAPDCSITALTVAPPFPMINPAVLFGTISLAWEKERQRQSIKIRKTWSFHSQLDRNMNNIMCFYCVCLKSHSVHENNSLRSQNAG